MSTTTTTPAVSPSSPKKPSPPSFKTDLYYGATKTHKTSNIGKAALYVWNKYQQKTRLLTADPGGYEPIQSLVDAGIVEPLILGSREHLIETADKVCQGYWPADTLDPSSPLLQTSDWSGIGIVAIEGLTSIGDAILRYWSSRGQRLSQDPNFAYVDGKTTYSGTNQSYYGEVQNRLLDLVVKSSMLPCRRVIWTALEGRGEETDKTPVYGPAIAGKKSIGKAGSWFGNMLHFELITTEGKKDAAGQVPLDSRVVMYLRPHADPISKIPFHAGTRAPFQLAHELPEHMPDDVGVLYEKLEDLKTRARASLTPKP